MATVGCDGETSSDDTTPDCGTMENPDYFEIDNIMPAPGSPIENSQIEHGFTMVRPDGYINSLSLALDASHTAGWYLEQDALFDVVPSGDDILISFRGGLTWANAPGTVSVSIPDMYDVDGCVYAFPPSIFSYDVVPVSDGDTSGDSDTDTVNDSDSANLNTDSADEDTDTVDTDS